MSQIDLAVLGKSMYTISQLADSHEIVLDPIATNLQDFKSTFFNGSNFSIVTPVHPTVGLPLIKIDKAVRNSAPIDLYTEVLQYAALDLDINESAITNITKVELFKECHNLTMSFLRIVSSLKWSDIQDVVTTHPIVITVVLTNRTPDIKNICIKFTYIVSA